MKKMKNVRQMQRFEPGEPRLGLCECWVAWRDVHAQGGPKRSGVLQVDRGDRGADGAPIYLPDAGRRPFSESNSMRNAC